MEEQERDDDESSVSSTEDENLKISIPKSGVAPRLWEREDVRSAQWARFLAKPTGSDRKFRYDPGSYDPSPATRAALVPSGLIDDAVVVTTEAFEASEDQVEALAADDEAHEFFHREPALMERLPPAAEGSGFATEPVESSRPTPPDKVEWFCFPSGSAELKYRVKRPRSKSHIFALFADGSPLRGVVLTFYLAADKVLSPPIVQDSEDGREPPIFAQDSSVSIMSDINEAVARPLEEVEQQPQEEEDKKKTSTGPTKRRLWVPVALCLLTRLSIVPALEAWLEQLARVIDCSGALIKNDVCDRILASAVQLADEVPRPMAGVLAVKLGGPLREVIHVREHFAASRGNQVRRFSDLYFAKYLARPTGGGGSLWLAACLLGPTALCAALSCVLLERPVLLIAESVAVLAPVAEALLALIRPFEWSNVYVPVLPKPLLELLDAPQPFLLGVQSDWLPDDDSPAPLDEDDDLQSQGGDLFGGGGGGPETQSLRERPRPFGGGGPETQSLRERTRQRSTDEESTTSSQMERARSVDILPTTGPRTPPKRFGSAGLQVLQKETASLAAAALTSSQSLPDDGLPSLLLPPSSDPGRSSFKKTSSSNNMAGMFRQTRLRRRLRGHFHINHHRVTSSSTLLGPHSTSESSLFGKTFRLFPTSGSLRKSTMRRSESTPPPSVSSNQQGSAKSRSPFWTTTAVSPGTVAFDLEAGAFFLPPGTEDSDDVPTLPTEFAAAVIQASQNLVDATHSVIDVHDWPVVPSRGRDAIAKAEQDLQRVCATHLEALIRGAPDDEKSAEEVMAGGVEQDAPEEAASPTTKKEEEEEEDDEEPPKDDAFDAEAFVATHPVAAQRAFLSRLVETQHFWQFVDSHLSPTGERSPRSACPEEDETLMGSTPRETLALRGFRFLKGVPEPPKTRRKSVWDPHDPGDAHCYTVPPPLPQDAAPKLPTESPLEGVPTHKWHPDPIFAAKKVKANATRVYRYGTLADLLGLRFEDLWSQLEKK